MSFQKRLKQLIDKYNLDATTISKSLGVSLNLVYFWISGERIPSHEKMIALAKYLNTSPGWLLFGEAHTMALSRENGRGKPIVKGKAIYLPIVLPHEIKHFNKLKDDFMMADKKNIKSEIGKTVVEITDPQYYNSIPVRIVGDAMVSPNTALFSLFPNMIVFLESSVQPKSGDYVAADAKGFKETIIRQYINEGGKHYLRPLNPNYDHVEIDNIKAIRGVITKVEYHFPR